MGTKAKEISARAPEPYKSLIETEVDAALAMQRLLKRQLRTLKKADLTIEVEMGDGRTITRANPQVQEFRALAKDYSTMIKALKDQIGEKEAAEVTSLADIRAKFKVAK